MLNELDIQRSGYLPKEERTRMNTGNNLTTLCLNPFIVTSVLKILHYGCL
jgi:hypothetical protein